MVLLYVICIRRGPRRGLQHPRTRVNYGAIPIALHPARACPHFCPSVVSALCWLAAWALRAGWVGSGGGKKEQGLQIRTAQARQT